MRKSIKSNSPLPCPLKKEECSFIRQFTYLLKRQCAWLAGPPASLSVFAVEAVNQGQGCNLLPLASCKAIPFTSAVINLSQ